MKKRLFISLLFSLFLFPTLGEASIPTGTLGVDVSDVSNQSDLTPFANRGAKYAIIRTSAYGYWFPEGRYGSDNATDQIQSAIKNNMYIMAYHRATFGDSSTGALSEAQFASACAKKYGIPTGSYLACDYEVNAGKDKAKNTAAILTFMDHIKKQGFQPLIYLGIDYAREAVDLSKITAKYKNCIWLANYPNTGEVIFPNMTALQQLKISNVIMYQFTDNWYGLNVDGNVLNLPIKSFNNSAFDSTLYPLIINNHSY